MANKYTKDHLIDIVIENNKTMTEAMSRMATAVDAINDSNTLHSSVLTENTAAIKDIVKVNTSFLSIFRWLILALVGAIIVLAGAEKVFNFLPFPGL